MSRQSRWIAARRAERRAGGLCIGCGEPVDPIEEPAKRGRGRPRTGARCAACREKQRK